MFYIPLNKIINLFLEFFFVGRSVYKVRNCTYLGAKSVTWKTLHVCKTLNLLVNFSTNTTYKQPFLLIFRPLSFFFWKIWTWWKKMAFIIVFSGRKDNWLFKKNSWDFFLQISGMSRMMIKGIYFESPR